MSIEQLQAVLYLVAGVSLFTIMALALRLIASNGQSNEKRNSQDHDWTAQEPLELVEVIDEARGIKSFKFRRQDGKRMPHFKAGQFLSFQIGDDPTVTRSYSISSLSNASYSIQVTIKLIEGGIGSTWFHNLKVGCEVLAYPPSGHFVDDNEGGEERVLIAGGVGITPILSLVQMHLEYATGRKITLIYGARQQQDLAFHGLLQFLADRHGTFTYMPVLSEDSEWPGEKGLVTVEKLQTLLGDFSKKIFYICGPEPMTEPLLQGLEQKGLTEEQIYNEKFVSPASMDASKIPVQNVKVNWLGKHYNYNGRQSLLEFLESEGESLPFACRSGVCGSCKCNIEGEYQTLTDAGLSRSEKKAGLALACVAFPKSDVSISPPNT